MNFHHVVIVKSFFLIALFILLSCASKRTTELHPINPIPSPQTSGGEPGTTTTPDPEQGATTEEVEKRPIPSNKITLVLGGAGVASFATIGLFKRLEKEGIGIDYVVASGWPALFSLGYAYLRTIHDLEWFAMRLQERDFTKLGSFLPENDNFPPLPTLVENAFHTKPLASGRIPVIISATNTDWEPEIYSQGDWKLPLLKTLSLPGLYRPFPKLDGTSILSSALVLNVREASYRGSKNIVALQMYDDYVDFLREGSEEEAQARLGYANQIRKSVEEESQKSFYFSSIRLKKPPKDLTAKRNAILLGAEEASRISKRLRSQQ